MFFFCRLQREEAKITAWENLQKAKAEAAIRKLEVLQDYTGSHWNIYVLPAGFWNDWHNNTLIPLKKIQMKLEKKRSSSMDKILNKFRAAQMKAQEMRNSISENEAHDDHHQPPTTRRRRRRTSHSSSSSSSSVFSCKIVKMASLSNYFFCCCKW